MKPIKFTDQHDYGWEVPACSRKDLILHAHAIHKTIGYKGDGPFPILKLVEHVFSKVYEDYNFDIATETELGDNLGKTYPDKHLIRIREDVYNAAVQGQGLARAVVAHECGHLLLHQGIPMAMARREATRELPAYKSSEWQANAIAGALLMPASKIIGLSPTEIIRKYNVSHSAAQTQLYAVRKEATRWQLPQL